MAEPLNKNPVGNNIEVLYSAVIDVGAVTAPSVGSSTYVSASSTTSIKSGSGFILIGSLQFKGDTKTYPLPSIKTMGSGGDGGEISYIANLYAELSVASGGVVVVTVDITNYQSTLYLAASKATIYILRVAASPAE